MCSNTGLRPMVYQLLYHVVGSGLFRRTAIIVTTMRFFPNQSNLHFIMTLSWSSSSRASKQNSVTLNKMMRQWEAEQTGMLRHSLLLPFRGFVKRRILLMGLHCITPACVELFESTVVYSSWYIPMHSDQQGLGGRCTGGETGRWIMVISIYGQIHIWTDRWCWCHCVWACHVTPMSMR